MLHSDFSIERVSLADQDPNWRISGYDIPTNDACIVSLKTEDGTCGERYAAAFAHLGATQGGTFEILERMGKALLGRDASASSLEQVMDLAANRRVDAINLKIPRSGGILNIGAMARMCAISGLGCRLGANVGSRLLAAHTLHVAAALPNLDFSCELAEFERLQNDPYEGIEVLDGELIVPDEIGTGVRRRNS